MKRILFYVFLAIQLAIIVCLVIQFEQIDANGQTITLQTVQPDPYMDYTSYDNSVYVEYAASKIHDDRWDDTSSLEWGDRVFVLLAKDADGLYTAQRASTQKLTTASDQEIVLMGKYQYEDSRQNVRYVTLGMEDIKNFDQYGSFNNNKPLQITLKIGAWGQYKIISIEQAN